mmetsp:Transcript_22785/g.70798  ORF Transcript_22785/g.70798 Transcript_22785/m.70798 type:complete len:266 (-) Transcript_22785:145-942(-)
MISEACPHLPYPPSFPRPYQTSSVPTTLSPSLNSRNTLDTLATLSPSLSLSSMSKKYMSDCVQISVASSTFPCPTSGMHGDGGGGTCCCCVCGDAAASHSIPRSSLRCKTFATMSPGSSFSADPPPSLLCVPMRNARRRWSCRRASSSLTASNSATPSKRPCGLKLTNASGDPGPSSTPKALATSPRCSFVMSFSGRRSVSSTDDLPPPPIDIRDSASAHTASRVILLNSSTVPGQSVLAFAPRTDTYKVAVSRKSLPAPMIPAS